MSQTRTFTETYDGSYGPVVSHHHEGSDGNPLGGDASGVGFAIAWQHGPRGKDAAGNLPQATGATVEDVARALASRLGWLQARVPCQENADALSALHEAIERLDARRADRRERQVEGVNKP